MKENRHTISDLYQMQSLPLTAKIVMTKQRLKQWYDAFDGDVYVSFSGGKDSTVLLDIARKMYPDIKAVFIDTGLEYPEIRKFVHTFENVEMIRPRMNFRAVIDKFGYPFISKEVSQKIYEAKSKPDGVAMRSFTGQRERYDYSRYAFLLDAPMSISSRCCNVMKKEPAHKYSSKTGLKPITAVMASESRLRTQKWMQNGCNAFDNKNPVSNPMSFWVEQDVLAYIRQYNIKICSVYGDIVTDDEETGQQNLSDYGIFDNERPLLKTTGCNRTGCMFCGYGCHLEKSPNRFEQMKITHPAQYDYIMRPTDQGGLGYKQIIDWINEHGNMNIKY